MRRVAPRTPPTSWWTARRPVRFPGREYHERSSLLASLFAQACCSPVTASGWSSRTGRRCMRCLSRRRRPAWWWWGSAPAPDERSCATSWRGRGRSRSVTHEDLLGQPAGDVVASLRLDGVSGLRHIVVPDVLDFPASPVLVDGSPVEPPAPAVGAGLLAGRALGPDDLFMINSTSGTTGLPKCVLHTENRWFYFHRLAVEAGALTSDDVFVGADVDPVRLRAVDGPLRPDPRSGARSCWERSSSRADAAAPSRRTGCRYWRVSARSSS